jgi:hypothetical protein
MTTSDALFNLGRRQAMSLVLLGVAAGPSIAADDTAKAIELLRVGDDKLLALALIQRKPDRTQCTTVLGAQKVVLEFDDGAAQYVLMFQAGYLTSKTVR